MRAKLDPMFYEYLLQVENGIEPITIADKVKLPIMIIIPYVDGVTCFDRCSISKYWWLSKKFKPYDKSSYIN